MFISSISARVGALSSTRGRGRWGLLLTSTSDRLMQEVDLMSPEQAPRRQGKEPNPGGGVWMVSKVKGDLTDGSPSLDKDKFPPRRSG